MVDSTARQTAIAEQIVELGNQQAESEQRLGEELETGFDGLHIAIQTRGPSLLRKLRTRAKDGDLRKTSGNHQRKASFPISTHSEKSMTQRAVQKTAGFFRRTRVSSHNRKVSDGDVLGRVPSPLGSPRLSYIGERHANFSSPLSTGR